MKSPRVSASAWIIVAFSAVLGLTLAVYLARAGAPYEQNWPANYNFASSDNSILFQFARDVFTGMTLDWSFSPQVYVFPEIPISLLAYLVAGGNYAWYYVVVALINVALLFASVWWLSSLLFGGSLAQQLMHAFITVSPLILFPLLNTHWMYLFHLAPTYYFGMYLFGLLLPAALLSPKRWARGLVLAGWMLAGAVSPLVTAMTLPGLAIMFFVTFLREKWSHRLRHQLMMVGIALVGVVLLRVLVFEKMAAASPLSYIADSYTLRRYVQVYDNFVGGFLRGFDPILFVISLVAVAFTLVLLIMFIRRMITRKPQSRELTKIQAGIYLTAFPTLGGLAMSAILAIDFYYLWPFFVGSVVISLLLLPEVVRFSSRAVMFTSASFAAFTLIASAIVMSQGSFTDNRYFGYRSEITKCLDTYVPGQIGYTTFSDARSNSLTSHTGVELIAVNPELGPTFWLTNKAQSREHQGTFVLVNPRANEKPLTAEGVIAKLGKPVATYQCGDALILGYK